MPVYKTPIVFLQRALLSILFQTYGNWELIIVDDCSQDEGVDAILRYYSDLDDRFRVKRLECNVGISAATNVALHVARGTYVGLVDHDDMLTRDALEKVIDTLSQDSDWSFIYSDECTIDEHDVVDALFHKPDWNPLLLFNFMYTSSLLGLSERHSSIALGGSEASSIILRTMISRSV